MAKKISIKNILILLLLVLFIVILLTPKQILKHPSIIGAVITKVYVTGAVINKTCNAEFLNGWSLISIPCRPVNASIGNALSSISGNYYSIHSYDAMDDIDHWKIYDPDLPAWAIQDLSQISEHYGYWINMKSQASFSLNGTLISINPITLNRGWNLIGYPSDSSKEISDALSTISGSYDIIWMFNSTDRVYYYYNPINGNGTLKSMRPYYGYWVNMTNEDTLFIIT